MKKESFWLLFLILLLATAALACGLSEGNQPLPTLAAQATVAVLATETNPTAGEPTGIPAEQPTEAVVDVVSEPAATTEPAAAPELAASSPATAALNPANNYGEPAGFDSYRMSLQFNSTLTGADGSMTTGSISIEALRDVLLNATAFTATAEGTADFGAGQQFTFTELGDMTYFILPNGGCTAFAGTNSNNPFAIFVDDGGVLGELEGAQLATPPTEMVNGILTNHYTFDETNLNPSDPTTPDITAVNGDIFLAVDGGFVVRIVMTGRGSSNLLNGVDGDGDINYELNYLDFDVPVGITVPTGCANAAP